MPRLGRAAVPYISEDMARALQPALIFYKPARNETMARPNKAPTNVNQSD
ncbi:MAG TPA: hypothetical protein VNV18_04475 [Stellaceae bacterium]|jgi:hypothetical protein|nr:hypothetical protein [Stellaceae bacterium]